MVGTIPPLQERYMRLVEFAHSRREPEPSDQTVSERSGVPVEVLTAIRNGQMNRIEESTARDIAVALGLHSGTYLSDVETASQIDDVQSMHERLLMFIEARNLGVQHIAARDTTRSPELISRVRDHLRRVSFRTSFE